MIKPIHSSVVLAVAVPLGLYRIVARLHIVHWIVAIIWLLKGHIACCYHFFYDVPLIKRPSYLRGRRLHLPLDIHRPLLDRNVDWNRHLLIADASLHPRARHFLLLAQQLKSFQVFLQFQNAHFQPLYGFVLLLDLLLKQLVRL